MLTIKEMLDSGVHFGHQTQRWNPKMRNYVYTSRGGIHIIDLQKSLARAKLAADFVKEAAARGKRIIFVGTKKQAVDPILDAAKKCGQFHVTKRWLGGTLTNFQTIKASIDRLKKIDRMKENGELDFFSKKERASILKDYEKLNDYLSGIREMKDLPGAMFVVDLNKEHIAVAEAKKLGIPVVAIADTNTDPEVVDYPIPGNDDAIRSIKLFANMVADAFLEGAKLWEERKRTMTDKSEDAAPEKAADRPEAPAPRRRGHRSGQSPAQQDAAPAAGPAIVKVSRGRRIVAAGTAEDVEIEMELESETSAPGETATEGAPEESSEKAETTEKKE